MSKAYSQDLREWVLNFLEINNNKKAASFLFKVSIASIYRWRKLKNTKGNLEPLRREYTYKKIDYDALKKHLKLHPDHFLCFKKIKNHTKKKTTLYSERDESKRKKLSQQLKGHRFRESFIVR